MPKISARLTDLACRNAKCHSDGSPRKLAAGGGLYLFITPKSKTWRMDYRFLNKRKTITLGTYPVVLLKAAEARRDEVKVMLDQNLDPLEQRRLAVARDTAAAANTFEAIAKTWFEQRKAGWTESTAEKQMGRLERFIFPYIGSRSIASIEPPELVSLLKKIPDTQTETMHRVLAIMRQVFTYAIASGCTKFDPTTGVGDALPKRRSNGFATVTDPRRIGEILRMIFGYSGATVSVAAALKLAPMLFVRPGELRAAMWSEIDLEGAIWRIPATKMKMRIEHIVPLSKQAVAVLRELHPHTRLSAYVFPNERSRARPMSENAVLSALRTMGIPKEELVGHGFRHMATTLLKEKGYRHEVVERQLAHKVGGSTASARYDFATLLPERTIMMQEWSDYLDGLRTRSTN